MFAARPIGGRFVDRHPSVKMLALSFSDHGWLYPDSWKVSTFTFRKGISISPCSAALYRGRGLNLLRNKRIASNPVALRRERILTLFPFSFSQIKIFAASDMQAARYY